MKNQNPVLQITEAKNLFLPKHFELTIKEYDDFEVKRFHQTRVRRLEGHKLKAIYTDWVGDRFCLHIDTKDGTVQLQAPSQSGIPEMAAIHLTRGVFGKVAKLLQRVYG